MNVGWALVGAGRHAELWTGPALTAAANARTVGVWSRDGARAGAFAARYGIPRVYATIEEALADPAVDAVYISTPNSLHAAHAIAAVRAGKHVLVEKPMATTVADATAMVRAADAAGVRLGVGFHLRHHPLHEEARRRVGAGALGELLYATAQFNLVSAPPPRVAIPHAPWKRDPEQIGGAGALPGFGVHVLDLLRWLSGQEVATVSATAADRTSEQPLEGFGQVTLEFGGGLQAHVVYGGRFPLSRNDVVLYGSKGRLIAADTIDVATGGTLQVSVPDESAGRRDETWRPEWRSEPVDHYRRQFEAFGRTVEGEAPFGADGRDGLRSVEVARAVIESYDSGRRVNC
jgi:1,5-anhydro-D-fructose reductase (1,5-anhydro-D-mannitol-forming)